MRRLIAIVVLVASTLIGAGSSALAEPGQGCTSFYDHSRARGGDANVIWVDGGPCR